MLLCLLLTACGGGDGGSPQADLSPAAATSNSFAVACSGVNCAAVDPHAYAGSGVGIWRYDNTSGSNVSVPVSINGVAGKTATLVFTNTADGAVAMPSISLAPPKSQQAAPSLDVTGVDASSDGFDGFNHVPAKVRDFDIRQTSAATGAGAGKQALARLAVVQAAAVGDHRSWFNLDGTQSAATLQQQVTAADGRKVNLWVADAEFAANKVTAAMVSQLADRFATGAQSVYAMVTGIAGQPWGPHRTDASLIGQDQDLDVVMLNITPDGQPYGTVGFFFSENNLVRDPQDPDLADSNEALALFVDTETLYLGQRKPLVVTLSTMGHELLHMINFYQRGVLLSGNFGASFQGFETWLEESTAMMVEDILSLKIDPQLNVAQDTRFSQWLANSTNCPFTKTWVEDTTDPCFSYNVAGSFGSYLLRRYGIGFYQQLLRDTSSLDSEQIMDHAIRQAGGAGLDAAIRDWGSSIALLPAATSPAGFGYPERDDSGFVLPAFDGAAFINVRKLPTSVPRSLQPYGHFPVQRTLAGAQYAETIAVPPGSSLSVIVK